MQQSNNSKHEKRSHIMTTSFFQHMLPLFMLMSFGYAVQRFAKLHTQSIAILSIYVISPVVLCLSVAKLTFTPAAIYAIAIMLLLCAALSFLVLKVSKQFWHQKTPYLAALMTGTNNWGYFGLPIAFALMDAQGVAIYVLLGFALQVFENSLGIYYVSRSHTSPLESIKRIFKFPVFYALLLGLSLSYFDVYPSFISDDLFQNFKGSYIVIGMMLIGMSLADADTSKHDYKYVALSLFD